MLPYELCKQLRDAGFPQNMKLEKCIKCGDERYHYTISGENILRDNGKIEVLPTIKNPTLSELIEACGDNLSTLQNGPDGWEAIGYGSSPLGNTPEEAVANLWLALNEKKV